MKMIDHGSYMHTNVQVAVLFVRVESEFACKCHLYLSPQRNPATLIVRPI